MVVVIKLIHGKVGFEGETSGGFINLRINFARILDVSFVDPQLPKAPLRIARALLRSSFYSQVSKATTLGNLVSWDSAIPVGPFISSMNPLSSMSRRRPIDDAACVTAS